MVIQLNLLPDELRAKKRSKLPAWVSLSFFSIPILCLLLCMVLDLFLLVVVLWKGADVKMLSQKEKILYPQQVERQKLEKKLRVYTKLVQDSSSWGQVMNIISDCLPDTGWFTKFDLDVGQKMLFLRGSFYSKEGGKGLTGSFISCLKSNPVVMKNLKSINSRQITQRKIKGTEVRDFYIECEIK